MPGADDLTQVVHSAFAEGFSVVAARILNREELSLMQHQANPFAMQDQQLGLVWKNPLACLCFIRKKRR
jgi:hypothetical protein